VGDQGMGKQAEVTLNTRVLQSRMLCSTAELNIATRGRAKSWLCHADMRFRMLHCCVAHL
jgi:hypothetical protein